MASIGPRGTWLVVHACIITTTPDPLQSQIAVEVSEHALAEHQRAM